MIKNSKKTYDKLCSYIVEHRDIMMDNPSPEFSLIISSKNALGYLISRVLELEEDIQEMGDESLNTVKLPEPLGSVVYVKLELDDGFHRGLLYSKSNGKGDLLVHIKDKCLPDVDKTIVTHPSSRDDLYVWVDKIYTKEEALLDILLQDNSFPVSIDTKSLLKVVCGLTSPIPINELLTVIGNIPDKKADDDEDDEYEYEER